MIFYYGDDSNERKKLSYSLAEEIAEVKSKSDLFGDFVNDSNVEILIFNSELTMAEAIELSEFLRVKRPDVKLLLLRKRIDVEILTKSLRAGISEVILSDDSSGFFESVKHLRSLASILHLAGKDRDTKHQRGKLLVVFSAKGGCGKTTVSINLATALAELKDVRVCLVDLDLQFGDVAVSLQALPDRTISSAIGMGSNIDLLGTRSIVTDFEKNFDLLLAPINPTDVEFISGEIVEKILANLMSDYDYVVVDTPPAFTDFVLKCMEMMNRCFLITTLDMPAIKNLKIVLETLDALRVDSNKLKLIVNRSDSKTGVSVQEAELMLGKTFNYAFPNDNNVSVAANQGIPLIRYSPKSNFSKTVRQLAIDTNDDLRPSFEIKSNKRAFKLLKREKK